MPNYYIHNNERILNFIIADTKELAEEITGLVAISEEEAINGLSIGWTIENGLWTQPKPEGYPSWLLNAETRFWEPPVTYPEDGLEYRWDENSTAWVEVADSIES